MVAEHQLNMQYVLIIDYDLRLQMNPFPVNPLWQVQTASPLLFVQSAC